MEASVVPSVGYDLLVLGCGSAAGIAVGQSRRRGRRVGWVCAGPAGPDPAELRALDEALRRASRSASAGPPGPSVDWPTLLAQIRAAQQRLAPPKSPQDAAPNGVDLLAGPATFLGPDILRLGEQPIRFHRAILAGELRWGSPTGNCLSLPPDGLTAEVLHRLEGPPGHVAIVGSGPRACLWAQAFARLGSTVYLVAREPALLAGEHLLAAAAVREALLAQAVQLLLGCSSITASQVGTQRALLLEREGTREKLFADQVLWEQPIVPELDGLNLQAAGVACSARGVEVNDRLQTTSGRIAAVGAVCGPPFDRPELSEAMARFAVENAFRLFPSRFDPALVPRCLGTDPPIAHVGWTPADVPSPLELVTYRADDGAGAVPGPSEPGLPGRPESLVLAYVRPRTGRLVGVTLVGEHASQQIATAALLLEAGRSVAELVRRIPCRPTGSEWCEPITRANREPPSAWQHPLQLAHTWWERLLQR